MLFMNRSKPGDANSSDNSMKVLDSTVPEKKIGNNDSSGSPLTGEQIKQLVTLHGKSSRLIWQQQNHLETTIDQSELDESYRELFNDDVLFTRIMNSDYPLWKQAFILGKFHMTEEMTSWQKSLLDLFLDFKFTGDRGKSLSGIDIKMGLLDPSRSVRSKYFGFKQMRGRELAKILERSFPDIDRKAKEHGYSGYIESRCLDNGISESQLMDLLDKVKKLPYPLEKGYGPVDLAFYIRSYDQMTTKLLPDLSTSELLKLIRENVPECFKDEFSSMKYYARATVKKEVRKDSERSIVRALKRLKGELLAVKINGIASREKVETAFCMPYRIPCDIRIRLPDDIGRVGFTNYKTMFHEIGHGLHFASMVNTGAGNIHAITEPCCFMEAMAKFFELFYFDLLVKKHSSGAAITGFKIASLLRLKHYASLVKILLLLVEKYKESSSMSAAIEEITSLYPGIYSKFMNTDESTVSPECWLGFLGAVQDPFYYIEYMLSYFIAYRLYASYESVEEYKEDWFKCLKFNLFYPANQIQWTVRMANFLENLPYFPNREK